MFDFMGVRHVGLAAKNLPALAAFYRDVMGMTIVRQTPADAPAGATLFLSRHPDEEDHEVVFVANPALAHTAFKVASLGELLASYRHIKERGVPIKSALNHGIALSFYFDDPEGHVIEIYWPTYDRRPEQRSARPIDFYAQPIDLDRPEEEVRREVERVAGQLGLRAPPTSR
jgi:catechol-2,3-dioxygenase